MKNQQREHVLFVADMPIMGNSKFFPCPMHRLRCVAPDNELAGKGSLMTALGLYLPSFEMNFVLVCVCVKERENKCVIILCERGYLLRKGLKESGREGRNQK